MSRLALGVIAAWLVVLASGFALVVLDRLDSQVDDALRVRAEAGSATVILANGRVAGVHESATDGELDRSIWIYSGARALERPSVPADVRAAADILATTGPSGYALRRGHRFYVLPIMANNHRIGAVLASTNVEAADRTNNTVILGAVVVTALLLLGTYPVLLFATGRALEPVGRMTRLAGEWSVTAPGQRFGTRQRYVELRTLAVTLDELLDRLAAVLRHERQLSAELSHELRTPLARIIGQIDLASIDVTSASQQADLAAIRANCVVMDGIIESLLAAARSDLVPTVGRCELRALFEELLVAQPGSSGPAVVFAPTSLVVGVEPALVARMLSPILENARRHAINTITIDTARSGPDVVIDVSNDGPRLDPSLADSVFEPGFQRSDEPRPNGERGAGLGLALARRLARSTDGQLALETTATLTTFRLTLPAG